MKVNIIEDRCQGHAMCILACPEIFKIHDDDGHAYVLDENVPAHLEENVRQAKRSCPEDAISVTE